MALNLVQHRGEPSIWDRTQRGAPVGRLRFERWLAAVLAGGLLFAGFRRRSAAGLLFAIGGAGLAWWAAAGADERRLRRGRLQATSQVDGRPMPTSSRIVRGIIPGERCAVVDADNG